LEDKHLIELVNKIISDSGDNPKRDGIAGTPERVAKLYNELLSGYSMKIEDVIKNSLFSTTLDDMIVVKNIEFNSLCEHDLTPFFGTVNVGYIPERKIIGLSKIPKIIEIFSKRLQVQENLTNEISSALDSIISPHGLGVVIEAKHLCSILRGDNFSSSNLTTSSMHGSFRSNLNTRQEFLSHIQNNIK
tara:strand:+ start:1525 stop:2091 length:567 start_codon:yes stop_codon:yes gene_type:complete